MVLILPSVHSAQSNVCEYEEPNSEDVSDNLCIKVLAFSFYFKKVRMNYHEVIFFDRIFHHYRDTSLFVRNRVFDKLT